MLLRKSVRLYKHPRGAMIKGDGDRAGQSRVSE